MSLKYLFTLAILLSFYILYLRDQIKIKCDIKSIIYFVFFFKVFILYCLCLSSIMARTKSSNETLNGINNEGPSHEERKRRYFQILYARRMRERQIFMDSLKEYRTQTERSRFKRVKDLVGPSWYQVLSVSQFKALQALKDSMYKDLIEGRPVRVSKAIRELGIYPPPRNLNLMNCIYLGKNDPMEMLAHLFYDIYNHPITSKRFSYPLNSRIILSAILYLGLENIFYLLSEMFHNEPDDSPPCCKTRIRNEQSITSPYLQKMVATLNTRPKMKRITPLPLPPLDFLLNQEDDVPPPIICPPPPPPPPVVPKKRLPRSLCDKLAGVYRFQMPASNTTIKSVTKTHSDRRKSLYVAETFKKNGLNMERKKKKRKILKPPSAILPNIKYVISGVAIVNNRPVYIIGGVTIIPPDGQIIHGGYAEVKGRMVIVHNGIRGLPPPPEPDPCNCVNKWQNAIFNYIKSSKCYCGHYYDFHHEGKFSPDDVPYFRKPTGREPLQFDYNSIYETDPKNLHINKVFKRLWETESIIKGDNIPVLKDKDIKNKRKRKASNTTPSISENINPTQYLKLALKLLRRQNIAASLPDVHLAPELIEWMRQRLHGTITIKEKAKCRYKSNVYWQMFVTRGNHGFGHVPVRKELEFTGHSNWLHKLSLNDHFTKFRDDFKLQWFRSQARLNNLLWPTMFQTVMPDKHFRDIYFSYLHARVEDVHLLHPYCPREALERHLILAKKRYSCAPAGVEPHI